MKDLKSMRSILLITKYQTNYLKWLQEEFKSILITMVKKKNFIITPQLKNYLPMFVNHTIQELNFYPIQFDNTLRFWNDGLKEIKYIKLEWLKIKKQSCVSLK